MDERVAALRAAARRAQTDPGSRPWLRTVGRLLGYMLLGAGLTALWHGLVPDVPGGEVSILVVVVIVAALLAQRRQTRILHRAASGQVGDFEVNLSDTGVTTINPAGRSELSWSLFDGIERVGDMLLLHMASFNVLPLPLRDLPAGLDADAVVGQVARLSGLPVAGMGAVVLPRSVGEGGLWRDTWSNLKAGALFFVLPRRALRHLRVSSPQLVVLLLLGFGVNVLGEWLRLGVGSRFNPDGVPTAMLMLTLVLLVAWLSARVAGDDTKMLPGAVAFASASVVGSVGLHLFQLLPGALDTDGTLGLLFLVLVFWILVASVVALVQAQGLLAGQRAAAVLIVLLCLVMPGWWTSTLNENALWYPPYDEAEYARWQARQERVTSETVLYTQPALLDKVLATIPAGRPGVPEFFTIAVGGDGSQDVFLREVNGADQLLQDRFDARGHVVLVNNPETIDRLPMASMTALKRTLAVIGERMNRDEDVLLLFLTSHGASDFRFHLSLWPYTFDPLTPETLSAALDEAGIRYRAIVVSACYSGGFVQRMAAPDTLVMSASRADRNSHGCSQSAEWTFFGRALFADALTRTYSMEAAFALAKDSVAVREAQEGFKPSEPQMAIGDAVRPVLQAIERRLSQAAAGARQAAAPSDAPGG